MSTVRHHQPWLHDLQIATHGNTTALSADGSFTTGAEGLYVDDRRVVSRLRVDADGLVLTPLAASSLGDRARFLGAIRDLGDPAPDPTVELQQAREVGPATLVDQVSLVSRSGSKVSTTLRIEIGGDGADLAEVKHGTATDPLLAQRRSSAGETPTVSESHGLSWADTRHRTSVTFSPLPHGSSQAGRGGRGAWSGTSTCFWASGSR